MNCQTYLLPDLANDKFQRLHHLPDPVPDADEKNYKPFADVESIDTKEEDMPSLKTVRNKDHLIPFNPLL